MRYFQEEYFTEDNIVMCTVYIAENRDTKGHSANSFRLEFLE